MMAIQDPAAQPVGPDSAELLRAAGRSGFEVSDRMLETFRAQGLMPRPHRSGYRGRAPVWTYPPGVDRQLTSLLRWRQRTKDPGLLKVLLWLDGFEIPVTEVRDVLARHLHTISETIEQAISDQAEKLGLDVADGSARQQAVEGLARTMAAKRGTSPVPRRSRVRADDRAQAVALVIRSFGLGETVEGTAAEGAAVERVLGVSPNGRRRTIADTGPWLTGAAEDLFDAASITGLPHLLDTVANSSDADLVAARKTVVGLFRHLPLMVRMIGAMFDDDNYTGLANLGQIDQHPETVLYILPAVIAMLKAGWHENLEAVTSALGEFPELAAQAQHMLDMPAATIEANLDGQPADVRERTQRIIDAAIDGRFDN